METKTKNLYNGQKTKNKTGLSEKTSWLGRKT